MARNSFGARYLKGSPFGSAQIAIDFGTVLNYNDTIHGAVRPLLIHMQWRITAVPQRKGG
jgi:hypothetical protein